MLPLRSLCSLGPTAVPLWASVLSICSNIYRAGALCQALCQALETQMKNSALGELTF